MVAIKLTWVVYGQGHLKKIRPREPLGTVVGGMPGVKKFDNEIWGDELKTAFHMAQTVPPRKINIYQTTNELVKDQSNWE